MSDLRLAWDVYAAHLAIVANDLETDEGLETAVIVSLFTDRRADDSDALPDGHTDRRGWWGDVVEAGARDRIGSRLWLLSREKQQPAVLARAEEYAREALAWLLDDRVAARVDVAAEFSRPGWLGLLIEIHRPPTDPVTFRYQMTWAAQAARSEAA